MRVHVYPHLGGIEIRGIRPSTIQGWLRGRMGECAPRYVRVLLANLSAVLGAAVEDGLIAKNPAKSAAVKAPAAPQDKVIPWPVEQVEAVVDAHPGRWQAVPVLAAGCGLRQGEVFGVRVEDIDFLGRKMLVRQQVKMLYGKPVFAPPKGGKTREGGPLTRRHYNVNVWKPALVAAGVEPTRANGMHALRHHYASVLLDGG